MNFTLGISFSVVSGETGITGTKCDITFDWQKKKKNKDSPLIFDPPSFWYPL